MPRDPNQSQGRDPRKGRRRRRPKKAPESPAQVIVQAKGVDTSKPADAPLTPAEAAEMKEHFKFLRDNRKLLQLRLNAAEDLLVNGVREPTHRGVCQHLLGKVDRARVELAAPRLEPAARSRFLAGVVRLSPEVPYLLLYLESVKDSASQSDATAALTRALRQIDFSQISSAQMRRLLDLIAELFDERDRPQLLFGLLQSATFREAFDRSAEQLPPELSESFVPLRAAHAVVARGKKNPFDVEALERGVVTLLGARDKVLRSHADAARRRLFELGLGFAAGRLKEIAGGLATLSDCFEGRERADAKLSLAGAYLRAERDADAAKLLDALVRESPGFRRPARWKEALSGEHFGRVALPAADARAKKGGSRWRVAFALDRQRPVWLRVGAAEDESTFDASAALAKELAIPGVLGVIAQGKNSEGLPYLAVPKRGKGAFEALKQDRELKEADLLVLCEDAVTLLHCLSRDGVALPNVRLDRFAVDLGPRLWLRDLVEATRVDPSEAAKQNLSNAKEFCRAALANSAQHGALLAALQGADTLHAVLELLRAG